MVKGGEMQKSWGRAIPLVRGVEGCVIRRMPKFVGVPA